MFIRLKAGINSRISLLFTQANLKRSTILRAEWKRHFIQFKHPSVGGNTRLFIEKAYTAVTRNLRSVGLPGVRPAIEFH